MKTFAVTFVLLAVFALTKAGPNEGLTNNLRPILTDCLSVIHGATEQDVDDVAHIRSNLTDEAKCLLACANDKLGFIKNGYYGDYESNKEAYNSLFADDPENLAHVEDVVNGCIENAKTEYPYNLCEAVYSGMKCFLGIKGK